MKFSQVSIVVLAAALVLGSSSELVHAQGAASSGLRANIAFTNIVRTPQDLTQPIEQPEEIFRGWGRNVVRIGQDYALKQGESVHDVFVIFSPASIDGCTGSPPAASRASLPLIEAIRQGARPTNSQACSA
jgi:hypothetical protein